MENLGPIWSEFLDVLSSISIADVSLFFAMLQLTDRQIN